MSDTARISADVIVVGAGPAGALAAGRMARGGLDVLLVERQAKGGGGAQWLNSVPGWMFDAAGIGRSSGEELHGAAQNVILTTRCGGARMRLERVSGLSADMRALGQRLVREFVDAGGRVLWETSVEDADPTPQNGQRVFYARERETGHRIELAASLFVDASGLAAVVRRATPALNAVCPKVTPEHICVAAQHVREVKNRSAAAAFCEKNGLRPGEILNVVGANGGFSLMQIGVSESLETVDLLTGSIALPEYPSGLKILEGMLEEHAWIGPEILGGHRAIPLRRPYTHLVAPHVALLGDAACQVYSSHGSGIGIGLIAAKLLAEAVIEGVRGGQAPGHQEGLLSYAYRFHRRWGGLFASADLMRRFAQNLAPHETVALLKHGLLSPSMTRDAIAQRAAKPSLDELPDVLKGAWRARKLFKNMAPTFARLPVINALATRYPKNMTRFDDPALTRFDRLMDTLCALN